MTDLTGSVSTMGGSEGGQEYNTNQEGKTTPRKMTFDKDARGMGGGGQYPNYWSHKTRSGHSFIMDDSKGNETITIQHRSGSAIQFRPDGGVHYTTHNGKYEVIFGEDRVTVSGAQDITVKGDASFRVYGNHNVTAQKDYNLTVMGDFNVTAKNMNQSIRGNWDVETKNINHRAEGSGTYNYLGAASITTKGNLTTIARKGSRYDGAGKDHHTQVEKNKTKKVKGEQTHQVGKTSNFTVAAFGDYGPQQMHGPLGAGGAGGSGQGYTEVIKNDGTVKKTGKDHSQKWQGNTEKHVTGNVKEKITGKKQTQATGGIEAESMANYVIKAASNLQGTAGAALDMRAPSGQASFAGASTVVNALSGALGIAGSAGVSLDSLGSLLNLNGGIAQIVSALGLQLSFDFGDIVNNIQMPDISGIAADQPTEEPDLTSEIDGWQ
jgi:hypothetical protein